MDHKKIIYDAVLCVNPDSAEITRDTFDNYSLEAQKTFLLNLIDMQNNQTREIAETVSKLVKALGVSSISELQKGKLNVMKLASSLMMEKTMNPNKFAQRFAGLQDSFATLKKYEHLLPKEA